jgi:DNA-binding NarL/FixJ family response regulator
MPTILLLQRDDEASPKLAARIQASRKFRVIADVNTVAEARSVLARQQPDVLMTDLRVQDGDVHPLLDELRARGTARRPHVLATMLSHDDALLLDALRAGADGYWVHARSTESLIETLHQLTRGESAISPTIAREVLSHFDAPAPRFDTATEAFDSLKLTPAEREILQWLARGYLIDEIARQWHKSVHSIACLVRRVVNKLQFERGAQHLQLASA